MARRCIETPSERLCNRCPRLWCTWLLGMAPVTMAGRDGGADGTDIEAATAAGSAGR